MITNTQIVTFLSITTLVVLSTTIIASGIWLADKSITNCQSSFENSFLFLTFCVILILACVVTIYRSKILYLVALFSLFLFVFSLTVFGLVVTKEGHGKSLSNRGYKEYSLDGYSDWFRTRVDNSSTWNHVSNCLVDGNFCKKLANNNAPQDVFFKKHLSPIQSGCCKPPENCGFTYISPTNWTKTGTPTNPDCNAWDNNPNTLCYDCTSCKAGFLHTLKGDWKSTAIANVALIGFLLIFYSLGFCAFCNNWHHTVNRVHHNQVEMGQMGQDG